MNAFVTASSSGVADALVPTSARALTTSLHTGTCSAKLAVAHTARRQR